MIGAILPAWNYPLCSLKYLFPLFQWHACKLANLSACIAKCMTTINKIYFYFTFIYLSKNLFTPRRKKDEKLLSVIGLKMICSRGLLVSSKVDSCFKLYIKSRLSVLSLVLNKLLKFFR